MGVRSEAAGSESSREKAGILRNSGDPAEPQSAQSSLRINESRSPHKTRQGGGGSLAANRETRRKTRCRRGWVATVSRIAPAPRAKPCRRRGTFGWETGFILRAGLRQVPEFASKPRRKPRGRLQWKLPSPWRLAPPFPPETSAQHASISTSPESSTSTARCFRNRRGARATGGGGDCGAGGLVRD